MVGIWKDDIGKLKMECRVITSKIYHTCRAYVQTLKEFGLVDILNTRYKWGKLPFFDFRLLKQFLLLWPSSAWYASGAICFNATAKRVILPVGKPLLNLAVTREVEETSVVVQKFEASWPRHPFIFFNMFANYIICCKFILRWTFL